MDFALEFFLYGAQATGVELNLYGASFFTKW